MVVLIGLDFGHGGRLHCAPCIVASSRTLVLEGQEESWAGNGWPAEPSNWEPLEDSPLSPVSLPSLFSPDSSEEKEEEVRLEEPIPWQVIGLLALAAAAGAESGGANDPIMVE